MDKKWWYAVDSVSVFDDEINSLSKYTFEQFKLLYEEKINQSKQKNLQKSSEIISLRNNLKIEIQNFISIFENYKLETEKIFYIDKNITECEI